jgi:MFS family permease
MLSLLVAETLGLEETALGIAFASLGLGGLASPLLAGVLADRAGPRPLSLAGLGSVAAGALLSGTAPSAPFFVAGQFLTGAGFSTYGVVAYAWINENLGVRRGYYLGIYVGSVVAGLTIAGISIALLLPYVGSWRTYFLGGGFVALVPALVLWVLLPERMGVPIMPKKIRKALAHRDVRWLGCLQFLVGLGSGGFSWLPLFLAQDRGLGLQAAVLAFVMASILWAVGGVAFGRLADAGWVRPTIALGGLATGGAYMAFVLWDQPWLTMGLLFLYAFLWPAGAQVPVTFLGQRLGPRVQRSEVGLLENLFLAGDAAGAALVGVLAQAWTLTWALALVPGAATLAAGALFGWTFGIGHGAGTVAGAEGA